ncbi:TetR/AcrR family transcriptional regulator [Mycobacterium paraterrae]|uniref:TetR/AcrR family transcriptional regulator n=1 Tax=Mycobacterium paraterrae TaxID=577492 RepID=A0ABY3VHN1_9MYCO|nr:TetR/AcrR family transcriptional regulator [Mycobacterium paraterrae]UMB68826.1 TetR/AcrR family transcriptional regulator [Mycobacterium paraterrae]
MTFRGQEMSSGTRVVDGRAARWEGQREKRREEFIEAALEAIALYGPGASTEQVAEHVGVTRTKLYRYFDGAADLHHSIARRASDMLTAKQTLVWDRPVSPMQLVRATVTMHVRWRIEHPNLYEYLTHHPLSDDAHAVAAIHDVNRTVAANLCEVIATYYRTLGIDERPAVPLSIGAVGFVESSVTHWLNDPKPLPRKEFTDQLAEWMWSLLNTAVVKAGLVVDPHEPIAPKNP